MECCSSIALRKFGIVRQIVHCLRQLPGVIRRNDDSGDTIEMTCFAGSYLAAENRLSEPFRLRQRQTESLRSETRGENQSNAEFE